MSSNTHKKKMERRRKEKKRKQKGRKISFDTPRLAPKRCKKLTQIKLKIRSPNDVIRMIEKSLNNIHTTTWWIIDQHLFILFHWGNLPMYQIHSSPNLATTGVYLSFTGTAMFEYEKLPRWRCHNCSWKEILISLLSLLLSICFAECKKN